MNHAGLTGNFTIKQSFFKRTDDMIFYISGLQLADFVLLMSEISWSF